MNVWTMKKPARPVPEHRDGDLCDDGSFLARDHCRRRAWTDHEMPRNIVIASNAITASVVAAFFA